MPAATVHWTLASGRRRGQRAPVAAVASGNRTVPGSAVAAGKLPRITRLMALAIKFEGLLAAGEVADYADLARLGKVTRARMTQIMNLLNLATDIQEEILFLPRTGAARDVVTERDLRPVTQMVAWEEQRRAWKALLGLDSPALAGTCAMDREGSSAVMRNCGGH